jgi:hypothetical protein
MCEHHEGMLMKNGEKKKKNFYACLKIVSGLDGEIF